MKILVIEDDRETADYISRGLREQGHVVDHAANADGLFHASDGGYDVLIVDRMLPGIEGLGLVRMLRDANVRTPVLFLTTLGGVGDRVRGLDAGGDDYLAKPFAFAELLARINALARRPRLVDVQTVLRAGDLEMDLLKRAVTRSGKEIELQPREFQLLEYLLRNAERVGHPHHAAGSGVGFPLRSPERTMSKPTSAGCASKLAQSGGPGAGSIPCAAPRLRLARPWHRCQRLGSLRTASFRLAALYLLLFTASAVLIGAVVFWMIGATLSQQLETPVPSALAGFAEDSKTGGVQALVAHAAQYGRGMGALDYLVQAPDGTRLAGELPTVGDRRGWLQLTAPVQGEPQLILAFAKEMPDGVVIAVGDNMRRHPRRRGRRPARLCLGASASRYCSARPAVSG